MLKDDLGASSVESVADEIVRAHGGQRKFIYENALKGFSIRPPERAAQALSKEVKRTRSRIARGLRAGEPAARGAIAGYRDGSDWKRLNTPRAIFDSGASRLCRPVTFGRVSVSKAGMVAPLEVSTPGSGDL